MPIGGLDRIESCLANLTTTAAYSTATLNIILYCKRTYKLHNMIKYVIRMITTSSAILDLSAVNFV